MDEDEDPMITAFNTLASESWAEAHETDRTCRTVPWGGQAYTDRPPKTLKSQQQIGQDLLRLTASRFG